MNTNFQKERYVAALQEIQRRGLRGEFLAMLRAHWAASRRTVSMSQLARAAGYPRFNHANIHYGGLASRIAKYGRIELPPNSIALAAVATWTADPRDARLHFAFTMRPGLADALEELQLTQNAEPPDEGNDAQDALEGEQWKALVSHRKREQRLRLVKIRAALEASLDGRLRCEVPGCGFDFETIYGATGAGYAHVHHLRPMSSRAAPERTKLADLAIVCANCHAMIHRFGASRPLKGLILRQGGKR